MRPLVDVQGQDVFVHQSLCSTPGDSVHDQLCRLLFFVGALRDGGARRITVVAPYLCYMRKDQTTQPHDPVTTRYMATLFEAMGIDAVIAIDVHNRAAVQNAFRCPTALISALPALVDHVVDALAPEPQITLLSPDIGGTKRVEAVRGHLSQRGIHGIETGFIEKYRRQNVMWGGTVVGPVADRDIVLIDDLVSTGTTLVQAAHACKAQGARRVFAVVTHGVFAPEANETLSDPALHHLVVSDTLSPDRIPGSIRDTKVSVIETAPLLADAISALHTEGPVVPLPLRPR